jgi:ABC-2 type transport system ATP-binding protein
MISPIEVRARGAKLEREWSRSAPPAAAPGVPLVEFRSVSKWYGPVIGVNEVSFRLETGITGLLGSNGAGKTTLIKLMTGQLRPSLGEVRVCGLPAWSARAKSHVGYCPDVDAFYEEMSGRAFVRTMARLHGFDARTARERTDRVLAEVGMADRADRRLGGYSKGMRQRIKLAQVLVHDPDIVVLDEPLNGVDPVGRREMMQLFGALGDRGKAVLVSSHILDDMDTLAERVFFMGRGRLLATGSLGEIREMLDRYPLRVLIGCDRARELAGRLVQCELVRGLELHTDEELRVQISRPKEFFSQFATLVLEEHFEIERLETTDASAGAVFDYVMQESARY